MRGCHGFSLVELIIVVMIIGIIGAIAIPRLSRGSEGAAVNAFVNEINTYGKLIEQYEAETGNNIADSSTGVFPNELTDYLQSNGWEGDTPLGGWWDIEVNDNGIVLAVGVHYRKGDPDLISLRQVDKIIDDGDLTTGAFRLIAPKRFYLVLEN